MTLPSGVSFLVGSAYKNDVKGLKITDGTPGGFKSCNFQWDVSVDGAPPKLGTKVVVHDSNYNKSPFVGIIADVNPTGVCLDITATRSTVFTRFVVPTKWAAGRRVYDALTAGLQNTPLVDAGTIVDPDIQFVQDSTDYILQTSEQLWNDVCSITSSLVTPLLWWIRGGNGSQRETLDIKFLDLGVRFRCLDLKPEQIRQQYRLDAMPNRSTVAWGQNQLRYAPNFLGGEAVRYEPEVIPGIIVDKAMNASNRIATILDADALARNYLARFSQFRSISDTIELKCSDNRVHAVYPIVPSPDDNYPLWLIDSGYMFECNIDSRLAPYNKPYRLIIERTMDFDAGTCTLQCGEINDINSVVELIESFMVNQIYSGIINSMVSFPHVQQDATPTYGPQYDGLAPPSFSSGIPTFIDAEGKAIAPDGKLIHPNEIADYGLEMNFVVPITSIGFKGSVRSIPGTYQDIEVILSNDESLFVADTCTLELYKLPKSSTVPQIVGSPIVCTSARTNVIFTQPIVLNLSDRIGFRVSVAAGATAKVASIALHGPKRYPDINVEPTPGRP